MIDEYLSPIVYDLPGTDYVALSAKTSCVTYAYEVAARFRERASGRGFAIPACEVSPDLGAHAAV